MTSASQTTRAVLPGYPESYFKHLIPEPQLNTDIFKKIGEPNYDYNTVQPTTQAETGTLFTPIDASAMYYSSLSWVSYPYGIPVDTQPCPFYQPPVPEEPVTVEPTIVSEETISSYSTSSDEVVEEEPEYIIREEIRELEEEIDSVPESGVDFRLSPELVDPRHYTWSG